MRSDGFIKLSEIIQVGYIKRFNPSMADFEEVVYNKNHLVKEWFQMKKIDNEWMIRAI